MQVCFQMPTWATISFYRRKNPTQYSANKIKCVIFLLSAADFSAN